MSRTMPWSSLVHSSSPVVLCSFHTYTLATCMTWGSCGRCLPSCTNYLVSFEHGSCCTILFISTSSYTRRKKLKWNPLILQIFIFFSTTVKVFQICLSTPLIFPQCEKPTSLAANTFCKSLFFSSFVLVLCVQVFVRSCRLLHICILNLGYCYSSKRGSLLA